MKKIIPILSLPFLLFFISCDKVKVPQEKTNTVVGTNFIKKSNSAESNYKKVLLEDYTGHTCGNCPPAATLAASLEDKHKDSIVVVTVHAGFFAKVKLPDYPTSYTTTAGYDWDGTSGFNISGSAGNPNGMVNRKVFPGYTLIHKNTWPITVALGLKDPFIVKLDVTTNYDPTVRALNTDVKATFKTAYSGNTKISLVLIEDSIISPQTDYSKSPSLVPNYEHHAMLRGGINGSWGDVLKNTPIAINDTVKISFSNFLINPAFNDKKIKVVVLAYDAATKEVIQVEKVKIR